MRVSKNQVTLLSAAVAALFAAGAQAQTTVTIPSASTGGTIAGSTPALYAQEINNNVAIGTTGINVNTILGIGTSNNQDRYVKFTLTNATFNSNVVAGDLTGVAGTNCVAAANITPTVAVGGLAGSSSVTFQVTTPAGANIGDCLQFNIGSGLRVAGTSSPVNVLYEVYEFLAQANAGTPVLYTGNRNFATFGPSVRFVNTNATQPTQTATALSGFLNFNTGGTSAATAVNVAVVGNITLDTVSANVPFQADGATPSAINVVLANPGNTITVSGDFTAAAGNTSLAISGGGGTVTLGAGNTSVSFANVNVAAAAGNRAVSYTVNGTTQVPPSTYTASFTAAPAAGHKALTYSTLNMGSIVRDGVQYESPWVTVTPGFISRFFLTQNSGNTVNWTAIVRNAAGLVTGGTLSGTIPSGRQVLLPISTLLPADTSAFPGPYQVTMTIAADASVSQGAYVLTAPNGSVSSVPLYRAANR